MTDDINEEQIKDTLGLNQLDQLNKEAEKKAEIIFNPEKLINPELSEKVAKIMEYNSFVEGDAPLIKLIEVANTWQGEGPNTGRQMLITRFKYCNRHCEFCDTWIKMKTSTEGSYSIDDLNEALKKTKALMITGGEPTMQTDKIHHFEHTLYMLRNCDYQLANIETNGHMVEALIFEIVKLGLDQSKINIIWSPKIFSESDYKIEKMRIGTIFSNPMVYVKIVADANEWSTKFIRELSAQNYDRNKIYLMPLGVTKEEIAAHWNFCVDLADECNANISSRLHIMNDFV